MLLPDSVIVQTGKVDTLKGIYFSIVIIVVVFVIAGIVITTIGLMVH